MPVYLSKNSTSYVQWDRIADVYVPILSVILKIQNIPICIMNVYNEWMYLLYYSINLFEI